MKIKVAGIILFILLFMPCCIDKRTDQADTHEAVIKYDSLLARELGADSYGMKQYVMAFLVRGENRTADSAEASRLQRAHLDNITRMAQEGKLILAGPFLDSTEIRGIYVFNVSGIEEAEELTRSDPAIKAGVLEMELHPWYGPAALQKLNEIQALIQKDSI
ncbi:MAG: YciI family protein [Bacteroidota bacterium]